MTLSDAGIYDLLNIFTGKPTPIHAVSNGRGIIDGGSQRIINIPAYQRPYRWEKDNINKLFEDYTDNAVSQNDKEYFLGSAVFVKKQEKNSPIVFDVVDGQQRITTLYLINYIRYLLKIQLADMYCQQPNFITIDSLNSLEECYTDIIGKKSSICANVKKVLKGIKDIQSITEQTKDKLISEFQKAVPVFSAGSTPGEELCLRYSRSGYNTTLYTALTSASLINTGSDFKLVINFSGSSDDDFLKSYQTALETIFENIWSRIPSEAADLEAKLTKAIEFADEIVENMSICVVLTENANDANKLFEVLNDRALSIDDLELIKNYFYMKYCTLSKDADKTKDLNIQELDDRWLSIFDGGVLKNKLISYLATMYFVGKGDIVYKDNVKYMKALKEGYFDAKTSYEFEDISADFNVYYAVKIILDEKTGFGLAFREKYAASMKAENDDKKSITYRTVHLLNALKYESVLPALVNIIIAAYEKEVPGGLNNASFPAHFEQFIAALSQKSNHKGASDPNHPEYQHIPVIHQTAYMLWTVCLKTTNYKIPRSITVKIIDLYKKGQFASVPFALTKNDIDNIEKSFKEKFVLDHWSYTNSRDVFEAKILLLHLLETDRTQVSASGTSPITYELLLSTYAYRLDTKNIQLDHLEAKTPKDGLLPPQSLQYYKYGQPDRIGIINGQIGNFMILDAKDNNAKDNTPLHKALGYYSKIDKSWMIQDIKQMINDPAYFDLTNNVPKADFFTERSRRLKLYFEGLLNCPFLQNTFTVQI